MSVKLFYVVVAIGLLFGILRIPARAQTTLTNPNIIGNANLISASGNSVTFANDSSVPNRIYQGRLSSLSGCVVPSDEVLQIGFNRFFSTALGGFVRDDSTKETSVLDIESCYNGSTEMAIDMVPGGSSSWLRPYGFYARYDGSAVGLQVGNAPYIAGAGGAYLRGGTNPRPSLLDLRECVGANCTYNSGDDFFRIVRQDGTTAMKIAMASDSPGASGRIVMSADGSDISPSGSGGQITIDGSPFLPSILFWQVGSPTDTFSSFYATGDAFSIFSLLRNGTMLWGPGSTGSDTNLYRSDTSTLRTDGSLVVGGNLAVMGQKAALVQTATHGQREVYAVESPGEWFEDFGSAKLINAEAIVKVDPVFGETVNTDREYHVFVTASGRCGLYVAEKQPSFFRVQRLSGSRGCSFDYRIVAKRRGYESIRLARLNSDSPTKSK